MVSIGPLYGLLRGGDRAAGGGDLLDVIMDQVRRNPDDFVWTDVPSIEELGRRRMAAMSRFLGDYAAGLDEGRYVEASLPELPFAHRSFDLELSSHFLFLQ